MKICIAGDEWACGEFGFINNKYYGVTHKGIEQYLKDENISVVNLSEKNASNIKMFNKLNQLDLMQFDYILYFQIDPFKDLSIETIVETFSSLDKFKDAYKYCLQKHYERLQSLNVPIYLLGASDKINEADLVNYSNLRLAIPSIMEFIIPTLEHPSVWPSGWEQYLTLQNQTIDPALVRYLIDEKVKRDVLMNKENSLVAKYFHPDGKQPNRLGHYELFTHIRKNLFKLEEEN